jgi:hypothetical protein
MKPILFVVAFIGSIALFATAISHASQGARRHAVAGDARIDCTTCPKGDGTACVGDCPLCSSRHDGASAAVIPAAR